MGDLTDGKLYAAFRAGTRLPDSAGWRVSGERMCARLRPGGTMPWGQTVGSDRGVRAWGQSMGAELGGRAWGQSVGSEHGVRAGGHSMGSEHRVRPWGQSACSPSKELGSRFAGTSPRPSARSLISELRLRGGAPAQSADVVRMLHAQARSPRLALGQAKCEVLSLDKGDQTAGCGFTRNERLARQKNLDKISKPLV